MRKVTINKDKFLLEDNVMEVLERTVKPFGTSAKADIPKKYMGKRLYVIVLTD
jgi:putative transposon-encoded protein